MRVSVADHAAVQGNEAVAEADIDDTAAAVDETACGEISEVKVDLVGAICRILGTLSTMLTVAIAPA